MSQAINGPLAESLLSRLSDFIASRTALHFPPKRWGDLQRKLGPAAREFGFSDQAAFVQWLLSTPLSKGHLETLASHLTISETYFWREPHSFAALEEEILPGLIAKRQNGARRLHLWSAGCASGEEPYSLAMALQRALPMQQGWQIKLLGTDINPRVLRRARDGVYGPWSLRNAPAWLKQDYLRPLPGKKFKIRRKIRDMVSFAYLNLAEDVYPTPLNSTTAMDVIFCRNVLMYFSPEAARRVIQRLHACLVEGGWLVVSAPELSQKAFDRFATVRINGATIYRKQSTPARPKAAKAPAPAESPPVFAPPPPPSLPLVKAGKAAPAPAPSAAGPLAPEPEAPRSPAHRVRAMADQGNLEQALEACEEALAADKLDAELHYLRATILQELDRLDEAVQSLRRALYLEPDMMIAHFALGNLLLRRGERQAAKRSFANVLGLLDARPPEEVLPQIEGLTAGRFKEITLATIQAGGLA